MLPYRLNPYVSFVESRLVPGFIQYGVAHRLTGEVLEPGERVRSLLQGIKLGNQVSFSEEQLNSLGEDGAQLGQLIKKEFLIPQNYDPLRFVVNQLAARPIQNPALTYKNKDGDTVLVRTSLAQQVYAPRKGDLPEVIEERMSPSAQSILRLADGTRTLDDIFHCLTTNESADLFENSDFRKAVDFLTSQERQLIKFTPRCEDLADPYKPVNTVPRDLVQAHRWDKTPVANSAEPIIDFHLRGIEDAWWEFDQIEATVNHALRFPNEMLGGLDYGSRFCVSTLQPAVLPVLRRAERLEVLEVGGGTGTFARSFIAQSKGMGAPGQKQFELNYHILDLSPALIENQKHLLADLLPASRHFQQDATKFDLPDHRFDLIISNEVVADFPMAPVRRRSEPEDQNNPVWEGDGAYYLEKYDLTTEAAPDSFLVNAGAMMFIERCWEHLAPGGALVLSEYGAVSRYPVQAFHLNHEEFSIHFGHLAACGTKLGFDCRLLTLQEFLNLDDQIPVFGGREEHILCLNHILRQHGTALPYAIVSQPEFEKRFQSIVEQMELSGVSFSPLRKGFYFGPRIEEFMVLIMNKPE